MKVIIVLIMATITGCMTVKKVEKIVAKAMFEKATDKFTINAEGATLTPGTPLSKIFGSTVDTSKCVHRMVSTTLIGCGGAPCNTCTCLSCGEKWTCY